MTQNLDFNKLVPNHLKNDMLDSLMSNLFNRFTSQEDSVQVEGYVGQVGSESPIKERNLERQINGLIPALTYSEGTEKSIFTFEDMIDKMNVLGIRIESLRNWMAEQTFNFSPPIDYDKFINFSNYFWVGKKYLNKAQIWNPTNEPEYYAIAAPRPIDNIKMPVKLATTRHINLTLNDRKKEKFTVNFSSSSHFAITSNLVASNKIYPSTNTINPAENAVTKVTIYAVDGNVAPAIGDVAHNYPDYAICEFSIVPGSSAFEDGDKLEVEVEYFTSQYTVSIVTNNLLGKGTVVGVNTATISPFMFVDGVRIELGDRILVKNQFPASQNGIYQVTYNGTWVRTNDAISDEYFSSLTKIYVTDGLTHAHKTFNVASGTLTTGLNFVADPSNPAILLNDWQIYNYWYHKDDLYLLGIAEEDVEVATRPIIEYSRDLQLNSGVVNNVPGNNSNYYQKKTAFNQIPLFDLFRYDGSHAGKVGGIFFYEEDPAYDVDPILQKRVKVTANSDFVFGIGLTDEDGRHLFFRKGDALTSIWRPGVSLSRTSPVAFKGGANRGQLTVSNIAPFADNQHWTIVFTSSTEANVIGTRSGNIGTINVGDAIEFEDFKLTLTAGTLPFAVNESFDFAVSAPLTPRYVKEENGQIINYPKGGYESGYAADQALAEPVGAWATPLRMFQNLKRDLNSSINYADFLGHARSVLRFQDNFTGTSYGNNNSRHIDFNPGLGGEIREFGSNFPLLASMLIHKDISPLTILNFAERQTEMAVSSIDRFIINDIVNYTTQHNGAFANSIVTDAAIKALADYFEAQRAANVDLAAVFGDSTAAVANWPVSLPMIGLIPKTVPTVVFDDELNQMMIKHHDGHKSVLLTNSYDLNSLVTKTVVLRSDGTYSGGIFGENAPTQPYAQQLWMKTSTGEVQVFNVDYDTEDTPVGDVSKIWFKRSEETLYEWDITAQLWVASSISPSTRWIDFNIAAIRNSLVLEIEDRLFNGIHPAQEVVIDLPTRIAADINSVNLMEIELAKFSATHNLDTYAPDYVSTDAFTWNYSNANVSSLGLSSSKARWYDLYKSYFSQFTAFELNRPDLEPWKLGSSFVAASENVSQAWLTRYAGDVAATGIIDTVRTVSTVPLAMPLQGLPIVDGVQVANGDKVLLVGQSASQYNGIYVVSSGGWFRANTTLSHNAGIQVTEGNRANTVWVVTTSTPITLDLTPLTFAQERVWKEFMWSEIAQLHPTMKLCVNTFIEALLPPYVSPSLTVSSNALMTTIPANIDAGYSFGDNGPVELVWKKSSEYYYSMARVFFKLYPLEFLDKSWGETYFNPFDNLRLERNLMASLPSSKFLMHGEPLNITNIERSIAENFSYDPNTFESNVDAELVLRCTHIANNKTIFTAFLNGGLAYNYLSGDHNITEGEPFSLATPPGVVITNVSIQDRGIPFNMGDTITVKFTAPIIEYAIPVNSDIAYGELGCEGCVVSTEEDPLVEISRTVVPPEYSYSAGNVKIFLGLGQLYTDLLRFNNLDTDVSNAATAYRHWNVNLVHRIGSLMRPDSLKISTNQGVVPETGYDIVLRASRSTESKWVSALRVQLVQMGTKVLNQVGRYIPKNDAADWIFRVEVFNPIHPQVLKFGVTEDNNFTTFSALDKENCPIDWKHYSNYTTATEVAMPQQITGLQNVINFIFAYTDHLESIGFKINANDIPLTDEKTGRSVNWQLEVEKLINEVYSGIDAGSAYILNPFVDRLTVQTPIGLLSSYSKSNFLDTTSSQCCFDADGTVIPVDNLFVVRTDEQTVTSSNTAIFSAHVFIDEYEHVIVLNNNFSTDNNSAILFDPFLGESIKTAKMFFIRQATQNSKPTFDGYFLKGHDIARNISSSVDALQNVYDPSETFNEKLTSSHAMSLVGFENKSYFDDIEINTATQMNFWRSMISAKGTNLALSAFTNYKEFTDSSTDEFWAYKVGQYGDARERSFPEIKIQPNDTTRKFTSFQFYDSLNGTPSAIPQHIMIDANDDSRWYSIDDLGTTLRFDAVKISEEITVTGTTFPQYVRLKKIYSTDIGFTATTNSANAVVLGANTLKVLAAGTYKVTGYSWINQSKLSPVKLFDYKESVLDTNIGLWNPAIGVHAYSPLELINIQDSYDPAYYNYTLQTFDNPNYKSLKPWDDKEVGKVWWDTSKLNYVPYYDGTIFPSLESRLARWGALAEYGSVDVYEWTESPVHPSEYNELAKSQEGDTSIDSSVRLSGEVGFSQYYKSDKAFAVRPIAWSQASVGNNEAHPAFGPATFTAVYVSGDKLIIDSGRAADIKLTTDRHFGGWDTINSKPVGEVIIGDLIDYDIGSELYPSNPVLLPDGNITAVEISPITNTTELGTHIGKLTLTAMMVSDYIPEVPEVPEVPGTPAIPATPGIPGTPYIPSTPGEPGQPYHWWVRGRKSVIVGKVYPEDSAREEPSFSEYDINYNEWDGTASGVAAFQAKLNGNGAFVVGAFINLNGGSGTGAVAKITSMGPITITDNVGGTHTVTVITSTAMSNFGSNYSLGNNLTLAGSSAYILSGITDIQQYVAGIPGTSGSSGSAGTSGTPYIPAVPAIPAIPAIPAVPAVYKIRLMSADGDYQDVIVDEWNLFNDPVTTANSILDLNFDKFGLKITVKRTVNGIISSEEICQTLANPNNDIFIRETVNYITFISQLSLPDIKFSNDPMGFTDYGWRVWDQPSQLQLNADLPSPMNKWKPYIGDLIYVPISAELLESIDNPLSINLTLPRGITIYRYTQTWSEWNVLKDVRQEKISNGQTSVFFTLSDEIELNPNRLSIYINGIQIAPSDYVITGNTVNLVNILPEAYSVFLLYRAYVPSTAELSVDETLSTTLVRYRKDYEYTKIDQRSYTGNIIGSKYYFWVKNKSVVRPDQSMSLKNASNILRDGESTFMLFSRLVNDSSVESGSSFDSCTIAGLHTYVNDINRYKLRFLRDFTLRDDPEEVALKNVYTEWELIRPHQLTKIPVSLWRALTDSVCGNDSTGNSLPAKTRIDYDAKYGTHTRYGFNAGQIFCESSLALDSILNTILNTSLTIQIGDQEIVDYITLFNINASTTVESLKSEWFSDPVTSRNTMTALYRTARASQINEIFFDVLNEALANNFEFTDLFKTSLITVNSSTVVKQMTSSEQIDEFF